MIQVPKIFNEGSAHTRKRLCRSQCRVGNTDTTRNTSETPGHGQDTVKKRSRNGQTSDTYGNAMETSWTRFTNNGHGLELKKTRFIIKRKKKKANPAINLCPFLLERPFALATAERRSTLATAVLRSAPATVDRRAF